MSLFLSAMPVLALAVCFYAALCAASPFGTCHRCRGFGFRVKRGRRGRLTRGRHCRRCRGLGRRVRVGRHLYNAVSRLHREATTR
ncbi:MULTISPECIES: hypothetical protein [Streptomyces]|uniref:hypothetical protein n=1 Tax=Streptomyces TaxID=1883 RepID=UPI0004D6881A